MIDSLTGIKFECKSFEELSNTQLYEILQLRQEVFIVEQNCPYLDCDGKDFNAFHIYAYKNNELIAYTRLLPKGVSYEDNCSIGRVLTNETYRNSGLGKKIMLYSIEKVKEVYPKINIKISSQVYILKFYQNLGFVKTGTEYLEDDIPHHAMILDFGY